MAYWSEHSVGIATQTALNTPNTTDGDFKFIKATKPSVSFETETGELELMSGQIGAANLRTVGRRGGTISFEIPLEGMIEGYDMTTATHQPGGTNQSVPMWMVLVSNAMGSKTAAVGSSTAFWEADGCSNSSYTSGGVASATAGAVTVDNATVSAIHKTGEFLVCADTATSTTPTFGFIKSKSGTALTLAYDSANGASLAAASHTAGTATAFSSDDQPLPLTIRWQGENAKFCYQLTGAICESWAINSLDAGAIPVINFSYRFVDYNVINNKGGLSVPTDHDRVPRIIGSANGRVILASEASGGGPSSSTAVCGLSDVSLAWSCEQRVVPCHSSVSGVQAIQVLKQRYALSLTVPHEDVDGIYDSGGAVVASGTGAHRWQSALELGTKQTVAVEVGARVGKCLGIYLPSAVLTEVPGVSADEVVSYAISLEAAAATGETSDEGAEVVGACPINAACKIGLG